MNKTEKLICVLLGGVLAWYIFVQMPKQSKAQAVAAGTNAVPAAAVQTAAAASNRVETAAVVAGSVLAAEGARDSSITPQTIAVQTMRLICRRIPFRQRTSIT